MNCDPLQRDYGIEIVNASSESVEVYSRWNSRHRNRMAARIERIYEAATHRQLPLEKNMLPLVVKAEDEDGDVVLPTIKYLFRTSD